MKIIQTRIPTDDEICDMLNREDVYKILKIKHNPKDFQGISWQVMRTKFSILRRFNKI